MAELGAEGEAEDARGGDQGWVRLSSIYCVHIFGPDTAKCTYFQLISTNEFSLMT